MSNLALSQKMHAVADALAAYDHLPALSHASVWSKHHDIESETSLRFVYSRNELPNLCVWASALDVEVTISLSYGGSGEAFIMFNLGGCPAKLRVSLHSGQAYELGAALRHPISPDEPTIQVAPSALLVALGVTAPGVA